MFDSSDFRAFIDRVVGGDKEDEAKLHEEGRRIVRILSVGMLPRKILVRADESDVAQDTMLKAISDLPQFHGQSVGEFVEWLKRILSHTVQNLARAHKAKMRDVNLTIHECYSSAQGLADLCAAPSDGPTQRALEGERLMRLAWAMGELSESHPEQHRAVELKQLQQLKIDEVAKELGKSPEAAAGLYQRGIKQLRKLME